MTVEIDDSTARPLILNAINYFAIACVLAAVPPGFAHEQSASPLDEVVVTAKSLEEELPQQHSTVRTVPR